MTTVLGAIIRVFGGMSRESFGDKWSINRISSRPFPQMTQIFADQFFCNSLSYAYAFEICDISVICLICGQALSERPTKGSGFQSTTTRIDGFGLMEDYNARENNPMVTGIFSSFIKSTN